MSESSSLFSVREANWLSDGESLRAIRHQVFVVEQGVPAELEFDADDNQHRHVMAVDSSEQVIGTGRLSGSGKIGRMAVTKAWRRKGVGSAILQELVRLAASNGIETLTLSAQLPALPFYRQHGFVELGEIYQEAGISHQQMRRSIKQS